MSDQPLPSAPATPPPPPREPAPDRSPKKRRMRLATLLFVLAALLGALYFVAGIPLEKARNYWRAGKNEAALRVLQRWSALHLRPADYDLLLAAVDLSSGRDADATAVLGRLAQRSAEWFPVIRKDEVARALVGKGRYEAFLRFDTAVRQHRESKEIALYRAAAQLGTDRIPEAETTFATVDSSGVDPAKYAALASALAQRKTGSYPLVIDRDGRTIAVYSVANHDLVAVNSDFTPLVDSSGGAQTIEANLPRSGTSATIETTLDPFMQKAALSALGGYRGSMVVIDTRTSEILAVANSGPNAENAAFAGAYEPGSITKVLAGLAAIDGGVDLTKIFPLQCNGGITLDGRQFLDWRAHGDVPNIDHALAVSCNVAFGLLGVRTGHDRLMRLLQAAGYGGEADLGVVRPPLGRLTSSPTNDHELATAAIGLKYEQTNALHLAMIASMIAGGGELVSPRLVRGRKTILGEPYGIIPAETRNRVASEAAARRMIQAMGEVITDPEGTGFRAAVPGLAIALKTGTAGPAGAPNNSLIMAFAPVENPSIAIGMIAEGAGPAELAGAKIARDFFTAIRERLR